jgi:hypothetical protein
MDGIRSSNMHKARMGGSTIVTKGTKASSTQEEEEQKLGQ